MSSSRRAQKQNVYIIQQLSSRSLLTNELLSAHTEVTGVFVERSTSMRLMDEENMMWPGRFEKNGRPKKSTKVFRNAGGGWRSLGELVLGKPQMTLDVVFACFCVWNWIYPGWEGRSYRSAGSEDIWSVWDQRTDDSEPQKSPNLDLKTEIIFQSFHA